MKIFVSDLDGTLIDNALKNNDAVLDCVHRIKSSGNEFVIATGRTLYGTEVLDFFRTTFLCDCYEWCNHSRQKQESKFLSSQLVVKS